MAADLGVAVDLQRQVSEADIVRGYQQALAMVYAPHLEPFGLAPLEATSCGTPVIAVAEGGVRESIRDGENGLLVEDIAAMARAIDTLVEDPARARTLGARGAAMIRERWTLPHALDRLESALRVSLAGPRETVAPSLVHA